MIDTDRSILYTVQLYMIDTDRSIYNIVQYIYDRSTDVYHI